MVYWENAVSFSGCKASISVASKQTVDRYFERMVRRCHRYMVEHDLLPQTGWLLAVSGGPDSMALWRIAAALGREGGFRVETVHINHGLRSTAAIEAQHVFRSAQTLNTPCHVLSLNIPNSGLGPEGAARAARYLALEQVRRLRGLDAIATGHTADDQAETVLMRLFKGAGGHGLAAMQPRRGRIVRPLLWMRRSDTLRLSSALDLELVDDESNRDSRFLRSRIRTEILPLLTEQFGDLVGHLAGVAEEMAGVGQILDDLLAQCPMQRLADGSVVCSRQQLSQLHPQLRARWLIKALHAIDRPPRRARDSLRRFIGLVPGQARFSLDFHQARVLANAVEIQVICR